MAVQANRTKISVTLLLNNGVDSNGAVKTLSVNLGNLDEETYGDQQAWNIAQALAPCLTKSLYKIVKTETSEIVQAS